MSDTDATPTTPRDRSVCDAAPTSQGQRCPMGATLRERVLTVARAELALGVREDAGPNRDSAGRIAGYLAPCVRSGRRLGLTEAPWCAAFVSWCVRAAGASAAIYYRAAVRELVNDALGTGALRSTSYVPQTGDIAILARGNGNPLHGGDGHCGFYAGEDEAGNVLLLGGNQDDGVTIKPFPRAAVLAWISLGD